MQLYELARPRSLLYSGFHSPIAAVQHSRVGFSTSIHALHASTSTTSSELLATPIESMFCAEKRGNDRRYCLLERCKALLGILWWPHDHVPVALFPSEWKQALPRYTIPRISRHHQVLSLQKLSPVSHQHISV